MKREENITNESNSITQDPPQPYIHSLKIKKLKNTFNVNVAYKLRNFIQQQTNNMYKQPSQI